MCFVLLLLTKNCVFLWEDHPWLREGEASDEPIDSAVLSRLKQFRAMNKLKKLALKVILYQKLSLVLSTYVPAGKRIFFRFQAAEV